jgi:hypothetical protein
MKGTWYGGVVWCTKLLYAGLETGAMTGTSLRPETGLRLAPGAGICRASPYTPIEYNFQYFVRCAHKVTTGVRNIIIFFTLAKKN